MAALLRFAVVALAATALGAGPAAAQSKAPGVTDTEIVIGLTAPMSGPAAIYGNLAVAKEAWARYVNDLGGVQGRKLKVAIKDEGFNPGRAVADMIIAVEGLKGAGRNLTRDGFIAAMEGIRNFTVLGLSAPITFGPDRHHGLNAVRLMRAHKAADFSYVQIAPYQVFKPLF